MFETIRIYQGHPFLLERHLGRLARRAGSIEDPFSFDEWTDHCRELIARNKVSDGILRLYITRGTGKRGYSSMGCSSPTVLISPHDAPPVADPKTRVDIITAPREFSVTTIRFPRSRPPTTSQYHCHAGS